MNKLFKSATLIALVVFGAISTESCKKGEEDPGLTLRSRDGRLSGTWTMMSYTSTSESTTDIEDPDRTNDGNRIKEMDSSSESWDGTSYTSTESDMTEYDDGSESSSETSYSGGNYTSEDSYTSGGTTIASEEEGTYTYSQSAEYTFERDGTFSMTRTSSMTLTTEMSEDEYDLENVESSTETTTVTGTWAWLGANDANEIANEERVALWFESNTEESSDESDEDYTDKDPDDFYDYDDDDNTSTSTSTWSWTGMETEPDEIWSLVQLRNTEMKAMVEGDYSRSYDSENKFTSGGTSFSNSQSEETTGSYMMEITFEKQ